MIKFANIPLFGHHNLEKLNHSLAYSDGIQMALTHLVLKGTEYPEYLEAMAVCKERGDYIILDNSLIEIGRAMNFGDVLTASEIIAADEVVLPDVFRDGSATIEAVTQALDKYTKDSNLKYMAVCHGENAQEFKETFHKLVHLDDVDTIGIPKVTSTMMAADGVSRNFILTELYNSGFLELAKMHGKEIHLLGAWTLEDMLFPKNIIDLVRSIDTVLPSWETFNNRTITTNPRDFVGGRTVGKATHEDLEISQDLRRLEHQNMNTVKEWLRG